jgi:integrase
MASTITTDIIFDHRGKKGKDDVGPIEIRVTYERKARYIGTGVSVARHDFVGGSIVGRADKDELNRRVNIIFRKVQEEVNRYIDEDRPLDVAEIKRRAWSVRDDLDHEGTALIDFVEEQQKLMGLKPGTEKHYITLRTRMREYGHLSRWDDVNVENLCRWDAWLHNIKKPLSDADRLAGETEQCISDGAVYNYHKCLKAILNRAVLFGKIEYNPYDRLRGKFKRGDKESVEFLTNEEMQAVESVHPVKGTAMAVARDLFVFQMHTGLSYADLQAFDFSEYKQIDGKWVNVGHRVKTGVQYLTMLTDECIRILEQYGWKLPKMGNADYNHALKAIGMAAGVATPLHSHLARHSFATRAKAMGIDLANIARMLGHTNTVQTQRYAKVMPEQVFEDLRKIERLSMNKYHEENAVNDVRGAAGGSL